MTVTPIAVDAEMITGAPNLDSIQVFWADYGMNKGQVVITCFGSAWTAYFGAMPEHSIREFFAKGDTGYLVNKMGHTPHLKSRKSDDAYLAKIINAVKASMVVEVIG